LSTTRITDRLCFAGGDGIHRRRGRLPLSLTVQESSGRVRLWLGTLTHGDGPTLQDATDDLVKGLLSYAMAFRGSGMQPARELGPPDLAAMDFLYQLGEFAAAGGDLRSHLFD
jgi:hypothetical protein